MTDNAPRSVIQVDHAARSRTELLLPGATLIGYPPARAEAAAKEIRLRLDAFRATATTPESDPSSHAPIGR